MEAQKSNYTCWRTGAQMSVGDDDSNDDDLDASNIIAL